MQNLDDLANKISSTPLFLRLKNVVENGTGWHDHEDVFSHSVKTANIAKKERDGEFVTNPESKELFTKWMDEDVFGMKRKDVAVIIALLHDCGEIVVREILKDSGLDEKLIEYIAKVIKQHGLFSAEYYVGKEKWSESELLNDVKSKAEGLRKESLFNMYCDGYTAPAFSQGKAKVKELFNMPPFYVTREYFIP